MDIFNKLSKKASDTYKYTTEKTGKLAKEAKLKMTINENKSNINDLYKEIGKKVYEKHIREENIIIRDELEELCIQIDDYASIIEDANHEILSLRDKKICEKCAYEIEKEFHYCPNCGNKQEENTQNRTQENEQNNDIEIINEMKTEIEENEKVDEEMIQIIEEKEQKEQSDQKEIDIEDYKIEQEDDQKEEETQIFEQDD